MDSPTASPSAMRRLRKSQQSNNNNEESMATRWSINNNNTAGITAAHRRVSFSTTKQQQHRPVWFFFGSPLVAICAAVYLTSLVYTNNCIIVLDQNHQNNYNNNDNHHHHMMLALHPRQQEQRQQQLQAHRRQQEQEQQMQNDEPKQLLQQPEQGMLSSSSSTLKSGLGENNDNDANNNKTDQKDVTARPNNSGDTPSPDAPEEDPKQQQQQQQQQSLPTTTTRQSSSSSSLQPSTHQLQTLLPTWLLDYFAWHAFVRQKFPDRALVQARFAPKLLIRLCLWKCGGLHDRLGAALPLDLWLAAQTRRTYLVAWINANPHPLPEFLVPNEQALHHNNTSLFVNWTAPFIKQLTTSRHAKKLSAFAHLRGLVQQEHVDELLPGGKLAHAKIVTISSLGDQEFLRNQLQKQREEEEQEQAELQQEEEAEANEQQPKERQASEHEEETNAALSPSESMDDNNNNKDDGDGDELPQQQSPPPKRRHVIDLYQAPTFGAIFWHLFQPSPGVQAAVNAVRHEYGLLGGVGNDGDSDNNSQRDSSYAALHMRIRHPKGIERGKIMPGRDGGMVADRDGLPFVGPWKDFAVSIAQHGLDCLLQRKKRQLNDDKSNPTRIYLLSDSNDTVHYMQQYYKEHYDDNKIIIMARGDLHQESLHLDRQQGHPPSAYYGTFVDLILGAQSTCLSYGLGNFGSFIGRLGGGRGGISVDDTGNPAAPCVIQHRQYLWDTGSLPAVDPDQWGAEWCPNTRPFNMSRLYDDEVNHHAASAPKRRRRKKRH